MKLYLFKISLPLSILVLAQVTLLWIFFPNGAYLKFIFFPFLWCSFVNLIIVFIELLLQTLYPQEYKELFKRR